MSDRPRKRRRTMKTVPSTAATSKYIQYHCNYCHKDISNVVRIRSAVPTDSDFDLCVECFSAGVEIGKHKNWHEYRVMENLHFPFFSEDWGADEEFLLLEGLEIYGMENWEEVSEHVSTKTREQCEDHYREFYINLDCWPEPDFSNAMGSKEEVQRLNAGEPSGVVHQSPTRKTTGVHVPKTGASVPVVPELSGWMPLRHEFEYEWDNEAEKTVKDIEFGPDDTEESEALKLKLLEIYNWRLEIRAKHREFVLKHKLHDTKKRQADERKRTKSEKEMYGKVRKYVQVMDMSSLDKLYEGLVNENMLREKILKYQKYRSKGMRSVAEGEMMDTSSRSSDPTYVPERYTRRRGRPCKDTLNVSGKPSFDALSKKEAQFCSTYHLLPHQYLVIKEKLLRTAIETTEDGLSLGKEKAIEVFQNLDPVIGPAVYEFMFDSGWLGRKKFNGVSGQYPINGHPLMYPRVTR
mmetsp:Transcript_2273/g.2550  ORF Transcript_2273/g.2550 Transcript_2273/m.2550 type:complete len:464 (+) Transcript_2273:35-1426(+)